MIDDYRALAVFVAVAEHNGFTGAGKELGLSPSVIGHHINRLENALGITLLYRSTRSMSLTPDGVRILEPAKRMVAARNEAVERLSGSQQALIGSLKLSLPSFGYGTEVHQRLLAFIRDNPKLDVQLHHMDGQADIIRDGFDAAIRLGKLSDSGLKSRKIDEFKRIVVASPEYLRERSAIKTPADLAKCEFISFSMIPDGFELRRGRQVAKMSPRHTRLQTNSIVSVREAIKAGLGIQRLPEFEVADALASGELVQLLPDWALPVQGIFLVWPNTSNMREPVRALIDSIAPT